MDADLFLQQFGHLVQGKGGIKKLRDVILQLAVRGKLTEQNSTDEPAEVLLKKILKKKEAILGNSKVKRLHRSLANETTHDLPSSWAHTTLDELGVINPRNDCDVDTIVGFVPMTLVSEGYGVFPRYEERNWGEISKGYTHFANDDVGLAKITPCFENSKSCVFRDLPNGVGAGTTELHIFRDVTKTIVPSYVWIWIKSPEFLLEGERRMTGSAGQKRVPKDYFALKPFPLPPLAEQRRIVAKVDELMALCDKLEAEQKAQRTLKTQAVQSTLHHLTSAESPTSFGTSLNILERTFGNWFDDLATVKHLRATILQLAVQGKLVPQDSTDEPVSELLKRIDAEKKRLVKEGKIKFKGFPQIKSDEKLFDIPANWEWERLGNFATFLGGFAYESPLFIKSSNNQVLRLGNVKDHGIVFDTNPVFITDEYAAETDKSRLIKGDVLVTMTGTKAKKDYLFSTTVSSCNLSKKNLYLNQRVGCLRGIISESRFIELLFKSEQLRDVLYAQSTGTANQANIGSTQILNLAVPLPPLAEQKRIIAKVDELMALCDQLEAQITKNQILNSHLMDSLIHKMTKVA